MTGGLVGMRTLIALEESGVQSSGAWLPVRSVLWSSAEGMEMVVVGVRISCLISSRRPEKHALLRTCGNNAQAAKHIFETFPLLVPLQSHSSLRKQVPAS